MDLDALLEDPRAVVRLRVARSARPLLAARGLSVSMDELAKATKMSRRSLFRYFESRDALVAAALDAAIDWNNEEVGAAMSADLPFEEWLADVIRRIFGTLHSGGLGIWQLAATNDDDLSPELATVNRRRRENRRAVVEAVAQETWRRAGGREACPEIISDAMALTVSTWTIHAMVVDYDVPLERVVESTTALLLGLIHDQLRATAAA